MMEPATMVGAVVGGFLTKLLPTWLTTLLLSTLLIFISQNLWKKARSAVALENTAARLSADPNDEEADLEVEPNVRSFFDACTHTSCL
jgi:uncharacterized membrane protein YfcA